MIEYKRLKLRRDSTNSWYQENPVLLEGELGYDTTEKEFKIGDGVTEWRKLPYITINQETLEEILNTGYYTKDQTEHIIKTYTDSVLTPIQEELKTKVDNSTYETKINEIEGQIQAIPDVPTKVSQLENDSNFQNATQVQGAITTEIGKLATVAKTGSYNDLTDKPTVPGVPTKTSELENDSDFQNGTQVQATVTSEIGKLATVAKTGSYTDLTNKPTIPTVPTNVSAFTNDAKYQTDTEVSTTIKNEITKLNIPTKTSQLENDSNFDTISNVDNKISKGDTTTLTSAKAYTDEKVGGITVPTNVSELTNDSGYLTETNLKTINNESIVGTGNIEIKGGGGSSNDWFGTDADFNKIPTDQLSQDTNYYITDKLDYEKDIVNKPFVAKTVSQLPNTADYINRVKTINGTKITGSGDINIMKIIDSYQWWGTQEAYDALTDEQKKQYLYYYIEGDGGGSGGTVPTKVSQLENDANYQNDTQVQGAITTAIGKLNIPTKTSQLTNDSTYQTLNEVQDYVSNNAATISYVDQGDAKVQALIPTTTTDLTFTLDDGTISTLSVYTK